MKNSSSKEQIDFLNNRFESLVENGLDGVIIISAAAETTYVSRSITKILGYTPEEVMEMSIIDFIHPTDAEETQLSIVKSLENPGVPIQGHLSRVKHKNGEWVWIEAIITNMLHDPAINGIVDNFRDVTDRVNAEKTAKEASERLILATQGANLGIWEQDLINNRIIWDDILYDLYGLDKESFEGTFESWIALIVPEDRARIYKMAEEVVYGSTQINFEISTLRSDGTIRHIKSIGQLLRDEKGKPNRVIGASWDITERKSAELDLLRKNKLLSIAEKITMIGNWQWNLITNKVLWSNNLYHIFELEENSEQDYHSYLDFVVPEDKERVQAHLEKSLAEGIFIPLKHRVQQANGKIKAIQLSAEIIMDKDGKPVEMIGTCQDITKQTLAENELITQNKLLSIAEKITMLGNWQWDLRTNAVKWSSNLYHIFDVAEGTELMYDSYFGFVHPDDKERVTAHVTKSLDDKKFIDLVHRIKLANGTVKTIQLIAEIYSDEAGNSIELIGTCQDVTEQRKAENEIIRKNQLLSIAEKITKIGNWQWDIATDKVKWSSNLHTIFAVDESKQLVYDSYFHFVHPEDREKVTQHFNNSLEQKQFIDFSHRIILDDGTQKTIQLLAEVIKDDQGNVIELIGTCQDVTEQRMIENKFRGLLESAPDAMVIINECNLIELVNSETEKMFGYSKTEMLGQSTELILSRSFSETLLTFKKDERKPENTSKGAKSPEFLLKKRNGEEFPVEITLGKLHTDEGLLISAAIRDITIRKNSEAQLRKMAAIEAKNEEMEQLAYLTSHDLKEPLLTMKKYSQVLNKMYGETLGERGNILLDTIIESANRMEKRITELLDYSQLGQKKELEEVNCLELVNFVKADLNALIEANKAVINIGEMPTKIKAYPTELQVIFQNLIHNAIKFHQDEVPPVIQLTSRKTEEGWEFKVADNGIGIQQKDYLKIFAIFQKLHAESDYKGSGIGLAQTKKLVELHNGQIRVESSPGIGTTFTFCINTENL